MTDIYTLDRTEAAPPTADLLTPRERRHLGSLEKRIERGMTTFREVGEALAEIRDQRLYRETHVTFDAYCRERWQFDRGRAYQLISAAEVARAIPVEFQQIANEAQARELVPLVREDPDLVRTIWKQVTEGDAPVSASRIRQVVRQNLPKPEVPPAPQVSATPRLVQAIDRLASAYREWVATRPGRTERELVRAALGRLNAVTTGEKT
jgi:hypothetical protein